MSHNLWHITLKVVTSWFWILVTELRYWWQVWHQQLKLEHLKTPVTNIDEHQFAFGLICITSPIAFEIWCQKFWNSDIWLWSQRGPLCTFELDEHFCGDSLWDPIVGSLSSMLFSRFSRSWPFNLGYQIAMMYA